MKTKHYNWLYWVAQGLGWFSLFALNVFFNSTQSKDPASVTALLIGMVTLTGFGFSHIFRTLILRKQIIDKSLRYQLVFLFTILISGALLQSACQFLLTQFSSIPEEKLLSISLMIVHFINWIFIYLVWLVLYMFYQVVQKQRSKIIQELQLNALKNEIELTNLKAQLNPHFMFNSMNSIRALVDENPQTAKTAITKLSGLLRNSLQYSKRNYVKLREELELVNDYLFLEKMRFEERLDFSFDIASETMEMNFPPLMLQTIVENALKHGIAELTEGGIVKIMAVKNKERFEIMVSNSGKLNQSPNENGIGISNTMKRLRILYGSDANILLFEQDGLVHCKIIIPVEN